MVWKWYLPAFMTSAGIGAFLYLLGVFFDWKYREKLEPAAKFAVILSWMVLALAGFFVLLDLGKPAGSETGILHILNVFRRWPASPLSLETSVLLATLAFGLLATLGYLAGWLRTWPRYLVEAAGAVPALILGLGYGGLLYLVAYTLNPVWHTPVLSLLTLSLTVAAAAAVMNLPNASFFGDLLPRCGSREASRILAELTRWALLAALVLTPVYLLVTLESARFLLGGGSGVKFWTALVLGVIAPLVLGFSRNNREQGGVLLLQIVLVVLGAYLLNLAVVQAGQLLI